MELGQFVNGCKPGNYLADKYHTALIFYLIEEIDRVYWNKNQKEWDRLVNPEIPGMTFRSYDWSGESEAPNLAFEFSVQEIRWYKHPGRCLTYTLEWTPEKWIEWFNIALEVITKVDRV